MYEVGCDVAVNGLFTFPFSDHFPLDCGPFRRIQLELGGVLLPGVFFLTAKLHKS